MRLNARKVFTQTTDTELILLAIEDITERKQAEQALTQGQADLERRVQERTALLELLQDITRAANEAPSSAEALQYAVDRLCASTGWPVGHAYLAMAAGAARWAPIPIWHLDAPERFRAFQQATQSSEFAAGEGLHRAGGRQRAAGVECGGGHRPRRTPPARRPGGRAQRQALPCPFW